MEEEIDIDLNDPAVGKVAERLQTGFFSRFGAKKEVPKNSAGSKTETSPKNIENVTNTHSKTMPILSSSSNEVFSQKQPQSVLTKEGKEALTSLAEKNKYFTEDIKLSSAPRKSIPSNTTPKTEVKSTVATKMSPKPTQRKNIIDDEQKKMNAELGVKRAQFCYSSSSPSDEEIKSPFDLSKQQLVEQRKKQLGVFVQNPPPNSASIQKPPRLSHGRVTKVDKVTKLYAGKPVNQQTNELQHSSLKRWSQPSFDGYEKSTSSKNIKNIKQMYNQAIAEASTPPSSPKPGPASKVRKNVAEIYTSNIITSKPSSPYISPCISADNLSPRKVKKGRIQNSVVPLDVSLSVLDIH